MDPDVLLVGCGDLGADIGLRLARRGHTVVGIRRRADLVPEPLIGVSADLTRDVPNMPDLDLRYLVVALTARPRTTEAYRATYVDGLGRALDALGASRHEPSRAVLISSTGVYGDVPPDPICDEATPPRPSDGPGRVLREAEQLFTRRMPSATILRLSGLYGRGPSRLADQVRQAAVADPHRWTNRIHRDDAAAAAVHLLLRPESPARLYIGTDDEPALLGDVASYLADRLDAPAPERANLKRGHGKRLSNERLRGTGWAPTYPTFREGYAEYPED
ncbi:MAG: NAD-dependent epimerase/dehydratase family protein [Ornithinimicrobium sp.]